MPSENQSGMQCVECEGLLAEAIDGALHAVLRSMPRYGGRGHGGHALVEGAG